MNTEELVKITTTTMIFKQKVAKYLATVSKSCISTILFCCMAVIGSHVAGAQTIDAPPPPEVEGEWTFESAEIRERELNSNATYVKRSISSPTEVYNKAHFFPTPLQIRFTKVDEQTSVVSLTNPLMEHREVPYNWMYTESSYTLNLLFSQLNYQHNEQNNKSQPSTNSVERQQRSTTQSQSNDRNSNGHSVGAEASSLPRGEDQRNLEKMDVIASYYGVALQGNHLILNYDYAYRADNGKYIEGIIAVSMKKIKQLNFEF
jgi:hypothetical protein